MRWILPVSLLFMVAAASCDGGTAAEFTPPEEFVLQYTDVEQYNRPLYPGRMFFETNLAATPVAVPREGQGQVWDLSMLAERSAAPSPAFIRPPANAAFASATSAYMGFYDNNIGAASLHIPCTFFRQYTPNALYQLGLRQDSAAVFQLPASIGGTVTIPAQNIAAENGGSRLLIKYPLRYNDTFNSSIQFTENFVVNAPAAGLNGVSGWRRNSYRHESKVIGSGMVNIKNVGRRRAILIMDKHTDIDRYFLGNQLAPAPLLAALGLAQEATSVGYFYEIWADDLGLVATYTANSTNTAIVKLSALK